MNKKYLLLILLSFPLVMIASSSLSASSPSSVLVEDWESGIDPGIWLEYGYPLPDLLPGKGPDGSTALDPNGDQSLDSGVITREFYDISQGASLEFWLKSDAPPYLNPDFVNINAGFSICPPTDPTNPGELCRNYIAFVNFNPEDDWYYYSNGYNRLFAGTYSEVAQTWQKFRIHIRADGYVEFYRNDILEFIPSTPLDLTVFDKATLDFRGRSLPYQNYVDNISFRAPSNLPPEIATGGPYSGNEGADISLSNASATDIDGDGLSYSWSVDSELCGFSEDDILRPTLNCIDNGSYTASLTVSDGVNAPVNSDTTINVNNVAPTVESIRVPLDPVNIYDQAVYSIDVGFSDPAGVHDQTYTCEFDLDFKDSTFTVDNTVTGVTGTTCSSPLNYSEPGVYSVKVVVTDHDGATGMAMAEILIVIYDPEGGFVTGGGWIYSETGWCQLDEVCAGAEGKANFGFVSKFKRGAHLPTGNTNFQFKASDLHFESTSYDWLVVAGQDKAKYKGAGTINGDGNYGFMLTATDGSPDTFRIKIWDKDVGDEVVYDNKMGESDVEYAGTVLGGGNIVIHTKMK